MSPRTVSSSPLFSNLPNSSERRSKQRNGMIQAGPGSTQVSPNRTMAGLSIFYRQILILPLASSFVFLKTSALSSPHVKFMQKSVACVSQRFHVPCFSCVPFLCFQFWLLTCWCYTLVSSCTAIPQERGSRACVLHPFKQGYCVVRAFDSVDWRCIWSNTGRNWNLVFDGLWVVHKLQNWTKYNTIVIFEQTCVKSLGIHL